MAASFQTLRWRDGALEMLDQRVLPEREIYLRFDSAGAVAGAIRDMVVRGAPAIGCAAAYGIAVEGVRQTRSSRSEFDAAMGDAFEVLAASRPTAVNLFWSLARMRRRLDAAAGAVPEVASALLDEAHAMCREDVELNRAMGVFGAALLRDGARVLTHCNAGALATAGHGTA